MTPPSYQTHLQSQLNRAEYLLLTLLINLLQSIKQVKLEALATACHYRLHLRVGVKKWARFLSLPQLTLEKSGFYQTKASFAPAHVLYIAIDRTKWGCINLLMISLIWDRRAYPCIGNFYPRETVILRNKLQPSAKCYRYSKSIKQSYWGPEFCSVKLGNWHTEASLLLCASQTKWICASWNLASVKGVRFNPWNCLYLNGWECDQATGIYARSMWHVSGQMWWRMKDGLFSLICQI